MRGGETAGDAPGRLATVADHRQRDIAGGTGKYCGVGSGDCRPFAQRRKLGPVRVAFRNFKSEPGGDARGRSGGAQDPAGRLYGGIVRLETAERPLGALADGGGNRVDFGRRMRAGRRDRVRGRSAA